MTRSRSRHPDIAKDTDFTVVYIMGYGRSGSTITDILLNSHPSVVSIGALNNIYEWVDRNEDCACGENVTECPFWSNIIKRHISNSTIDRDFKHKLKRKKCVQDSFGKISRYPFLLLGLFSKVKLKEYADGMNDLFSLIASETGKSFIVDSSKSTNDCTGRPIALYKYTNVNIKIIHLVRDGRGVAWSAINSAGSFERKRMSEWKAYNFMRTTINWVITNLLALVTKSFLERSDYMLLRYEDLCEQPGDELERIGEFIGLDLQPITDKLLSNSTLEIGHNLGGNRVRFNSSLKFTPDTKWKREMPAYFKGIFWLLGGWIASFFGYRWSDDRN